MSCVRFAPPRWTARPWLMAWTVIWSSSWLAGQEPNWSEFRGPLGNGVAATAEPPIQWSERSNIRWKTDLPGRGWSSPVIDQDRIWLTTAVESEASPEERQAKLEGLADRNGIEVAGAVVLQALEVDRASGKLLRQIDVFKVVDPQPIHATNSYASPTPVLEGERLYCHFGTYGAACLDTRSGQVLWRNNDFHVDHQTGPGSSPLLWKDLLIVHLDGTDQQLVAALDKHTGSVRWTARRSGAMHDNPSFRKAFCTPIVVEDQGEPLLISPAADWCYAYAPGDGREIWKAAYGDLGFSNAARPVAGAGIVYISTGFMQPEILAIRWDGRGDVSRSHILWRYKSQAPKVPSPLLVQGRLYLVSDGGVATLLNAETGQMLWRERVGGAFWASPLYAAGRVYFFSQDGECAVYADSKAPQRLALNKLEGRIMASPAALGKALYVRSATSLYRIEDASR